MTVQSSGPDPRSPKQGIRDLIADYRAQWAKSSKDRKSSIFDHTRFVRTAKAAQSQLNTLGKAGFDYVSKTSKGWADNVKNVRLFNKELGQTNRHLKTTSERMPGGTSKGSGSLAKRLGARAWQGPLGVATMGGLAFGVVKSAMMSSMDTVTQTGKIHRKLSGSMTKADVEAMMAEIGAGEGKGAGFGRFESMEQVSGLLRATGGRESLGSVQRSANNTNMEPGELFPFMGQMTQAGVPTNSQGRWLERVVAAGQATGLKIQRVPEFLQGMHDSIKRQGGLQAGKVDMEAQMRSLLLLSGMGEGGRGARGAAIKANLDAFFQQGARGGLDEAKQAFLFQAMGHATPGGQTNYFDAIKQMEEGGTPGNIKAMAAKAMGHGGGNTQESAGYLSRGTNNALSQTQAEAFISFMSSGGSGKDQDAMIKKFIAENRAKANPEQAEMLKYARQSATIEEKNFGIAEDLINRAHEFQLILLNFAKDLVPVATKIADYILDVLGAIQDFKDMWRNRIGGPGENASTKAAREGQAARKYILGDASLTDDSRIDSIKKLREKTELFISQQRSKIRADRDDLPDKWGAGAQDLDQKLKDLGGMRELVKTLNRDTARLEDAKARGVKTTEQIKASEARRDKSLATNAEARDAAEAGKPIQAVVRSSDIAQMSLGAQANHTPAPNDLMSWDENDPVP